MMGRHREFICAGRTFSMLEFSVEREPNRETAAVAQESAPLSQDFSVLLEQYENDLRSLGSCLSMPEWLWTRLPYIFLEAQGRELFGDLFVYSGYRKLLEAETISVGEPFRDAPDVHRLRRMLNCACSFSVPHDEEVISLRGLQKNGSGRWKFEVGPANYSDFLRTNGQDNRPVDPATAQRLPADMQSAQTVRDAIYQMCGGLPAFDRGAYSHTVGVATVLRTSDGYWIFAERDPRRVGVNVGINVPASGGTRWNPEALRRGGILEVVLIAMREEICAELGLLPRDYYLIPLGALRELPRGGSPEFFFLAVVSSPLEEVVRRIQSNGCVEKLENAAILAQPVGETYQMLNTPGGEQVLHHKLMVALLLAREYFLTRSIHF